MSHRIGKVHLVSRPMDERLRKYMDMIISMTTDCVMEGITVETYLSNLEMALENMKEIARLKP